MKVYKPKYSAATFDMARADYIAPPRLGAAYHSLTETGTIPSTADSESLRRLVLDEIPVADGSMRVTIAGTAAVLVPVGRTINAGDCEVDYDTGILTFNATDAGKAVSVTYKGNGSALMPQDMAKYPKYESDGNIAASSVDGVSGRIGTASSATANSGAYLSENPGNYNGSLNLYDDEGEGVAIIKSEGGFPKYTSPLGDEYDIVTSYDRAICYKRMFENTVSYVTAVNERLDATGGIREIHADGCFDIPANTTDSTASGYWRNKSFILLPCAGYYECSASMLGAVTATSCDVTIQMLLYNPSFSVADNGMAQEMTSLTTNYKTINLAPCITYFSGILGGQNTSTAIVACRVFTGTSISSSNKFAFKNFKLYVKRIG